MLGKDVANHVPTNFWDVVDVQLLQRDGEPLSVDSIGRLVDGHRGEANILGARYKQERVERQGQERSQRNDAGDLHDFGVRKSSGL